MGKGNKSMRDIQIDVIGYKLKNIYLWLPGLNKYIQDKELCQDKEKYN